MPTGRLATVTVPGPEPGERDVLVPVLRLVDRPGFAGAQTAVQARIGPSGAEVEVEDPAPLGGRGVDVVLDGAGDVNV